MTESTPLPTPCSQRMMENTHLTTTWSTTSVETPKSYLLTTVQVEESRPSTRGPWTAHCSTQLTTPDSAVPALHRTNSPRLANPGSAPAHSSTTDPLNPTASSTRRLSRRPRLLHTHLPPMAHISNISHTDTGPANARVMTEEDKQDPNNGLVPTHFGLAGHVMWAMKERADALSGTRDEQGASK